MLKSFSTQLISSWYPTMSGNGYQLHDDVYGGNKADGTTLLSQSRSVVVPTPKHRWRTSRPRTASPTFSGRRSIRSSAS